MMKNNDPFSLENKVVLVTGASSGIGKAIAIECANRGALVYITARNSDRLSSVLYELNQISSKGHKMIIADISLERDINNLVEEVCVIDGCVMCAGISKNVPLQFIKSKDLQEVFNVNTIAPIMLTQKLVKSKKIKKGGSLVFMSSVSGNQTVTPAHCIYTVSKSALSGFMRNAAIDLAAKGIRCNSINPGMVNTDMIQTGLYTKEQIAENIKEYPLKRYGNPEEVAYAAIYLLSDASSWVTGHQLVIDGGLTLK